MPFTTYEYRIIATSDAGNGYSDWSEITTMSSSKYKSNVASKLHSLVKCQKGYHYTAGICFRVLIPNSVGTVNVFVTHLYFQRGKFELFSLRRTWRCETALCHRSQFHLDASILGATRPAERGSGILRHQITISEIRDTKHQSAKSSCGGSGSQHYLLRVSDSVHQK